MNELTTAQYRAMRRIFLRTARCYRNGSAWGPADGRKLRAYQQKLASIRGAYPALREAR